MSISFTKGALSWLVAANAALSDSSGAVLLPFEFDFISVYELGDEDYAVADKGAEKRRYRIKGPTEIVRVKVNNPDPQRFPGF